MQRYIGKYFLYPHPILPSYPSHMQSFIPTLKRTNPLNRTVAHVSSVRNTQNGFNPSLIPATHATYHNFPSHPCSNSSHFLIHITIHHMFQRKFTSNLTKYHPIPSIITSCIVLAFSSARRGTQRLFRSSIRSLYHTARRRHTRYEKQIK